MQATQEVEDSPLQDSLASRQVTQQIRKLRKKTRIEEENAMRDDRMIEMMEGYGDRMATAVEKMVEGNRQSPTILPEIEQRFEKLEHRTEETQGTVNEVLRLLQVMNSRAQV